MRKIMLAIITIALLFTTLTTSVSANSANSTGVWLYDDTGTISDETKTYVEKMNETFSSYDFQPKFAVIFTNHLPDENADEYLQSLFLEYGMSYSDDSYDVLLYFAIEDKQYDIEHGGAYNKDDAFLINQELKICMIGEDASNMLTLGEYDEAAITIAKRFERMMEDQNNGTYAVREARRQRNTKIFGTMFVIAIVVVFALIIWSFIKYEKKKEPDSIANNNSEKKEDPVNDLQ